LPCTLVEASASHALAETAFFQERLLEVAKLFVEEVVRLVNEADQDVGDDLGWARFEIGLI
jgi:hypothetical protein